MHLLLVILFSSFHEILGRTAAVHAEHCFDFSSVELTYSAKSSLPQIIYFSQGVYVCRDKNKGCNVSFQVFVEKPHPFNEVVIRIIQKGVSKHNFIVKKAVNLMGHKRRG
jgi:hypothetical protein